MSDGSRAGTPRGKRAARAAWPKAQIRHRQDSAIDWHDSDFRARLPSHRRGSPVAGRRRQRRATGFAGFRLRSGFTELGAIEPVQITWIVEATQPPRLGDGFALTTADQFANLLQAPLTKPDDRR